jgi:uncharacterized protein with FMN-binding domain
MAQSGSNKKVANSLVAMSSAAVLAVYAAGYARTRFAADRIEAQAAERRPAIRGPPRPASPNVEFRPAAPNAPAGAPSPATSAPSNPARDTAGKPGLIASLAPVATTADVPGGAAAPPPAETPAPSSPTPPAAVPVANQAAEPAPPAAEHKAEVAAAAPAAPAPVAPAPAAPAWKDGTYYGWGTSRHGDIQAAVVIEGGRIASATIAQCWTRYSCSVISNLPPQVAQRQSPETDYVSGATQSVNAFYYGVVEALKQAK